MNEWGIWMDENEYRIDTLSWMTESIFIIYVRTELIILYAD